MNPDAVLAVELLEVARTSTASSVRSAAFHPMSFAAFALMKLQLLPCCCQLGHVHADRADLLHLAEA